MFPFRINFSLLGQAFEIGPYTLFFLLAIVVVVSGCFVFAVRRGFAARKIALVLLVMLVSAVIGARLMNVLINFKAYFEDPSKLWVFSAQGFSEYGGILFAVISGYVTCRILKLNPLRLGDTFVPFLGAGIAVMRIGCFLNGCCYGVETDLPWGVTYPTLSPAHLHQIGHDGDFLHVKAVHPTQLYEMAAALFFGWVAWRMVRRGADGSVQSGGARKTSNGTAMVVFLTGFSLFRFVNNFLRVQPDSLSVPVWFYPTFYAAIVAGGIFWMALDWGNWRKFYVQVVA